MKAVHLKIVRFTILNFLSSSNFNYFVWFSRYKIILFINHEFSLPDIYNSFNVISPIIDIIYYSLLLHCLGQRVQSWIWRLIPDFTWDLYNVSLLILVEYEMQSHNISC